MKATDLVFFLKPIYTSKSSIRRTNCNLHLYTYWFWLFGRVLLERVKTAVSVAQRSVFVADHQSRRPSLTPLSVARWEYSTHILEIPLVLQNFDVILTLKACRPNLKLVLYTGSYMMNQFWNTSLCRILQLFKISCKLYKNMYAVSWICSDHLSQMHFLMLFLMPSNCVFKTYIAKLEKPLYWEIFIASMTSCLYTLPPYLRENVFLPQFENIFFRCGFCMKIKNAGLFWHLLFVLSNQIYLKLDSIYIFFTIEASLSTGFIHISTAQVFLSCAQNIQVEIVFGTIIRAIGI